MRIKTLLYLALALFINATAFAAVTNTAMPKFINGNWMVIAHYGDPNNVEGNQAAIDVKQQQADYKAAKDNGDTRQMVANALWSSVQAWALNNEAHRILGSISGPISGPDAKDKAGKAKSLLVEAQTVLDKAPAVDAPEHAQAKAFDGENDQRAKASLKIESNLLYAERILGEQPWPKAKDNE